MTARQSQVAGIDVGGTFTDLVIFDSTSRSVRLAKTPTTLDNQAGGVLNALVAAEVEIAALDLIVHGTTTTTNAVLERQLCRTGLITTAGFRDILELGRRTRPQAYGMKGEFRPIIPRDLRTEVPERMDAAGAVVTPLDEAALAAAIRALIAKDCEALVIHFLHSYANPAHELRAAEIARVTDRLAKVQGLKRPLVMMERAGGYSDDCCMSFGNENFGKMVDIAGGKNFASDLIPGTFGTVNPEAVVAANPEVVIITGGNWGAYVPGGAWVGLGPGSDLAEARRKLANLAKRPAFGQTKAVKEGRVHAIWHQFYNSPYQFVAIQEIATWLHPELFKDLDAEATLKTLHERFLPLPYQPGYWVTVERK